MRCARHFSKGRDERRTGASFLAFIVLIITILVLFQCLTMTLAPKAGAEVQRNYSCERTAFRDGRDIHRGLDSIMDHAYPKLHPQKREKYRASIMKWSERYDLCPLTVASIIWKESKFDEKCRYLGALGPMQTIPRYHRDRMAKAGISVADISTIDKGVHIGCIVFRHYMDKSKGNVHKALKYYNGCVNAKNSRYVRDVLGMRDKSRAAGRKDS